jgi:hypothetical protein
MESNFTIATTLLSVYSVSFFAVKIILSLQFFFIYLFIFSFIHSFIHSSTFYLRPPMYILPKLLDLSLDFNSIIFPIILKKSKNLQNTVSNLVDLHFLQKKYITFNLLTNYMIFRLK